MSELRKANTSSPYFITLSVAGWIDVFTRERYCKIFLDNLNYCIENKNLEVFAYVVMPSHIHLIVRHLDENLPGIIRNLKSYTAKVILNMIEEESGESRKDWMLYLFKCYAKKFKRNSEHAFWQRNNYPVALYSQKVIQQKIGYIHLTPVAAGYVAHETHWTFSSANNWCKVALSHL